MFGSYDGALPDIELGNLQPNEVVAGYQAIRDCSTGIESENPYYWSRSRGVEVPIGYEDNPAAELVAGDAEPFHLCFSRIISPGGCRVPTLGVFVFPDMLSLDYRAGKDWDEKAIQGLLEIIGLVDALACDMKLEHKGNLLDPEGMILGMAWREHVLENRGCR